MNAPARAARELRLCLLLVAGASLFVHLGTLVVPLYDMHLFDTVLQSHSMETLVALSLACLAGVTLYAVLSWLRAATMMLAGVRLSRWLSDPVLEAGLRRSLAGDPRAGADALRDLSMLRAALAGPAATTPFDLLWSPLLLAVLFLVHPAIGWLGVAGIGVLLLLAILVDQASSAPLRDAAEQQARAVHEAGRLLHDRALAVGLGMQDAAARRFHRRTAVAVAAGDRAHRRAERLGAVARLARHGLQGVLIALGALLVLRHEASPGALIGANLLFAMLLAPIDQAIGSWRQMVGARLAWQRLAALLRENPPPVAANDDVPGIAGPAGLSVRGVGVRVGGQTILSAIGVDVAAGELLLVTGPSGAGKSTLARVLAGVLAPTEGSVRLDGEPIDACARLRRIGYLPARLALMDATVFETIARFADAAAEDVVDAARRAGIHAAIGRLPDGYGTRIGPNSSLLSGGQKQRLALARALFGRPRLIVLDEPDASLDHEGETALRQALSHAAAEGAVVVAVSHRPALMGLADVILHLDSGRLTRIERRQPLRNAG
jgi:ATP-binding cassette subfamily C protein